MGIQDHSQLPFENDSPFPPAAVASAPPAIKYRTFALPAQQAAFDAFARDHHEGLLQHGMRRWRNPTNNMVTLSFNLGQPRWLDSKDPNFDRIYPPEARQVIITIPPGAEASIPAVWSRAIATPHPISGVIHGGLCPWLQPVGCAPLKLAIGINVPAPFEPPQGAA